MRPDCPFRCHRPIQPRNLIHANGIKDELRIPFADPARLILPLGPLQRTHAVDEDSARIETGNGAPRKRALQFGATRDPEMLPEAVVAAGLVALPGARPGRERR